MMGIAGIIAFNLVDAYFVGQLGKAELAAMSFTFPVVMIVGSLTMGIGMGISALVSRAIGEGNRYKVQRLTTDGLSLSMVLVIILCTAGIFTIDPVFTAMGADEVTLPLIREYMQIWYLGMVFLVIPMAGNSAIRATGDTKTPGTVMIIAAVVNGGLDPLLIFGIGPFPRMELAGAATATVIARATTLVVSMYVLYYRDKMITFAIPKFKEGLASWKQVLYIGLPNAGSHMILPLGIGVLTRLVSSFGKEAVAAFGVAGRIDAFGLSVIMALSSVVSPFVGQNLGAGKMERVRKGVAGSQGFALLWGLGVSVVLILLARPVASQFNDDPAVIDNIVLYLWIVPVGYGARGVFMVTNSALNVLGKPLHAAALILIQMFVLYIPLAYLGAELLDLPGVFGASVLASVVTGALSFWWLRRLLKHRSVFSESLRL